MEPNRAQWSMVEASEAKWTTSNSPHPLRTLGPIFAYQDPIQSFNNPQISLGPHMTNLEPPMAYLGPPCTTEDI